MPPGVTIVNPESAHAYQISGAGPAQETHRSGKVRGHGGYWARGRFALGLVS